MYKQIFLQLAQDYDLSTRQLGMTADAGKKYCPRQRCRFTRFVRSIYDTPILLVYQQASATKGASTLLQLN